jgi:hypothetical protein
LRKNNVPGIPWVRHDRSVLTQNDEMTNAGITNELLGQACAREYH